MTLDPIHQFNIDNLFKIGQIGNQAIYFTNSSVYMLVSVAVICLLIVGGAAGRQLVPGRFQSMAEVSYEFVASMIRSNAGPEGMRFFPLKRFPADLNRRDSQRVRNERILVH